mgnify:FL=1
MKIKDILKSKRTISCEFFPPRDSDGIPAVLRTAGRIRSYNPDFVSVTYGAGGSTRAFTEEITSSLKRDTDLEVMAHLTCVAQTEEEVHTALVRLDELGIENVIALRGDPPTGQDNFVPAEGGFKHATELLRHVRDNFEFCLAAACYPEGHVESSDLITDMNYVKMKVENGADFLVTQLFYDNQDFFRLMERAETLGIDVPIIAGILPILNTNQIRRFTSLCGSKIPDELDIQLERYVDDDDAVRELGIEYATRQVQELWDQGIAGVHFYVLNRNYSVSKILDNLKLPGHIKTT